MSAHSIGIRFGAKWQSTLIARWFARQGKAGVIGVIGVWTRVRATVFGWAARRALWGVGLLVVLLVDAAPALGDRAMSTRFSTNDTGNITFAANTLMVCPAAAAGCTAARNTAAIASGTNNAINNNNYNMGYVNTVPGAVPGTGASFDSSSADLVLPSTATVLFAGLYWGADTSPGSTIGSPAPHAAPNCPASPTACPANQVGLRVPGAATYASVTATIPLDISSSSTTRYNAFADVTSQVQAAGAGTYSVANVQAGTGGDRYAGWTLVVAYRDPTQPPRNLTVDDGFVTVSSGSKPISIPVSGFKTPPTGPVRTTIGFVAYEGDAGLTGDSASLSTTAGSTTLSDSGSPANNFFCSSITNLGVNVATRNPSDTNNWAYDSELVAANGVLPNNATSANVVVKTDGDTYFPAVVTFATDLFAPNITSSKSVANITHPGGPDRRGDVLRYTVSYRNTGSDAATNFIARDVVPDGTTYVPNSLRIAAGPQAPASPTDAVSDDSAEFNADTGKVVFRLGAGGNATTGGSIAPNETDTFTFDVTINADATPGQQIVNQATANFTGATLGAAFADTSPATVNTVSAPALALSKTHAGLLTAGLPTTFTLSVSNTGSGPTDGTVTVTDPFPALAFSSIANAGGVGWSCATAGLTLTCSRSDPLAASDSYPPILVDATVQDPAPATIVNTATASGGGSADATASDGGGANGLADVSITKVATPVSLFSGDTVTFTLNVQNAGPSSAQNVTVNDLIDPASYSDVTADTTQGRCDTTVACSLDTVTPNSTVTITITATVIARDTTLTNNASASSPTPDPDTSNNSASASVDVLGTADLAIDKTGPANPMQGSTDTFTLSVSNNGPDTARQVVVNDTLPSQITATSASGGGFTCTLPGGPGGTLVCTIAALAPTGTAVHITITGTVAAGTAGQSIVDTATINSNTGEPDFSNNAASLTQLIGPVADVAISKQAFLSDGTTPVTSPLIPPTTLVYTLGVTNTGPSDATGVVVNDTLPTGMTLIAPIPAGCTGTTAITCVVGALAAGGSVTRNLNVSVGGGANNTAPTNTATVTSTTVDPDTSNNAASATVGVGAVANLALAKSVSPLMVNVGDLVTYTFAVTNDVPIGEAGGAPIGLGTTGGVVSDPLPPGVQFVAASPGSNCTDNPGPPDTVTCAVGPVAQSAKVTASFTARMTSATAGTTVQNQATVATAAAGGFPALPDFIAADNTDRASVAVNPLADLSLTKTVSDENPGTDDEVDYTLTAHNAGPNDATGVMIHDSLPAGLDFLDAPSQCTNENGTITCDVGTIASGDSASVTIKARTTATVAGKVVGNLATVSGDDLDLNPNNNQASATIRVKPLVDLRLTKVASNPTPDAGGPVSYTLTLVNNGPSPATGVTITDHLPSALTFESSTGPGSCSAATQTVTCHLGTVEAGAAAVVVITTRVAPTAVGASVENTATATADEPIARPALVTSNARIRAIHGPTGGPGPTPTAPEADLSISKKAAHKTARVGEPIGYTITATNHGPATASHPTVTDALAKPVEIASAHVSGGVCSKRIPIACRLGSIAPGHSVKIAIVVKPKSTGRLTNTAVITSLTPDPNTHNDIAHATVDVKLGHASLSIKKSASRPTVRPGQALSFTITVRSLGPAPALAVKVCDRLGSGMTFISVHGATFHHRTPCWTITSLAKGKQRRFVVNVRTPMVDGPRRLTNSATATADGVRKRTAAATVKLLGQIPPPPPPPPVTVTG